MDSKDISKPLDAGSFVSIMDSENIELFNRDYLSDTNQGWLWFMEQKRLQYYQAKRRWSNVLTILFGAFFFCALLFLMLAMKSDGTGEPLMNNEYFLNQNDPLSESSLHHTEQCFLVLPNERIDCNPDPPISKDVCVSRGCCWIPANDGQVFNQTTKILPPLSVPYCFFGSDYRGYAFSEVKNMSSNGNMVAYLHRLRPSGFLKDVQNVKLEVDELSSSVLRIKMTDSDGPRYEVPLPKLNLPKYVAGTEKQYHVQLVSNDSTLVVYRTKTGAALFQVNLTQLIYSDQFIQVTNKLPSEYIYGIGKL